MKFVPSLIIVILAFSLNVHAQIRWLTDYKDAVMVARETGKPLLLDFTAEWCKPCKAMEQTFWVRPDIIAASEKFVCVKVNFDSSRKVAEKFGVRAIPNVLVTDAWDTMLVSETGFGGNSDAALVRKLAFVPANFAVLKEAAVALDADEKNMPALAKFADFYQGHKFYFQSNIFNHRILKIEKDAAAREELLLKMGANYLKNGLPDDAIEIFEKFGKEFPNSPQLEKALFAQVLAYSRKDKIKPAQKILEQLRMKFPNSELIFEAETAIAERTPAKKK